MYPTVVENLVVRHSAARFAGIQGYHLEGDQAHLKAAVAVEDGSGAGGDWALQLWACEQGELRGIKVAELPVGSLPAAGAASLDGWTTALPPAGHGAHTMVLALASGGVGQFNWIHDLTVFSRPERFCQPALEGTVGYRFDGADVELSAGAVANPRNAENFSGSLSLELWALPVNYEGGAFEGFRIAGVDLGCLAGQDRFEHVCRSVPAQPVPAGNWRIVLMLREWTPAGFVTRDYTNFGAPLLVAEAVSAEAAADFAAVPGQEVEVPTDGGTVEPAIVSPSTKTGEQPQAKPIKPAATAKVSVNRATVAEVTAVVGSAVEAQTDGKAAEQAAASLTAKSRKQPQAKLMEPAATPKVSINRATAAELAALKGLSKTVAAAVVAARPYGALEEVLRAKGMSPKLLEKLRDQLVL